MVISKPKLRRLKLTYKEILFIFFAFFISALYLYNHFLYVVIAVILAPSAYALCVLISNKTYNLRINLRLLFLLVLITTWVLLNVYTWIFYKTSPGEAYTAHNILITNLKFFITTIKYIASIALYSLTSLTVGDLIFKFMAKNTTKHLSKPQYYFVALLLGLTAIGTALFFFGRFGLIKNWFISAVIALMITIFKRKYTMYIKELWQTTKRNIEIKSISKFRLTFYITLLVFAASILASTLRSFTEGPDGLRIYLTLERHLAEYGKLPSTDIQALVPYFTELLFSPAYLFGGVPLATSTMYTFSLLFIAGFYFIASDYISKKHMSWVLIPAITFPPFLNMIAMQYKIDIFLCLIASGVFFTTHMLLKTRLSRFALIAGLLMGTSFLVKLTTLFYIIPFTIFILIWLTKNSGTIKVKVISVILFFTTLLLPIVPWITLYKINTIKLGEVGFFTSSNKKSINSKYAATHQYCSIGTYENKYYGYKEPGPNKYLYLPYLYITEASNKPNANLYHGFRLTDMGLINLLLIFAAPAVLISRKIKHANKNKLTVGVLSLTAFMAFLTVKPELIWYTSPSLLLLTLLVLSNLTNNPNFRTELLRIPIHIIGTLYMVTFIFFHAYIHYYPLPLDTSQLYDYLRQSGKIDHSQSSPHTTYADAMDVSLFLNENTQPDEKVIFTFSASMVNINYFTNKYFDKVVYLDAPPADNSENDILKLIEEEGIKYLVLNNVVLNFRDYPCILRAHEAFRKYFDSVGEITKSTETFTVYAIKT